MVSLDRLHFLKASTMAGLAPSVAHAGPRVLYPGVYIEELTVPIPTIRPLETSETVLVTSILADPKPVTVSFLSALDDISVRLGGASQLERWVRQFFANGGKRLTLWPARDGTAAGLIGDRDPALGLKGIEAVGGLFASGWPGANRPLPIGLILVPEAAALAYDDVGAAASVYAAAAETAQSLSAMAIIDTPAVLGGTRVDSVDAVLSWREAIGIETAHAALYGNFITGGGADDDAVGPAVAGVIARTDQTRGVWSAPAGTSAVLRHDVAPNHTTAATEVLNPVGVNTIRTLPGAGTVVWAARTLAPEGDEDRFISVRRFRDHIRQTLRFNLQVLALQPNEEATWQAARASVEAFLANLLRAGAFAGSTPDEAYFVRCGLGETMTQVDLDQGRLIISVGFAPLRPAEFIVDQVTVEGFATAP